MNQTNNDNGFDVNSNNEATWAAEDENHLNSRELRTKTEEVNEGNKSQHETGNTRYEKTLSFRDDSQTPLHNTHKKITNVERLGAKRRVGHDKKHASY